MLKSWGYGLNTFNLVLIMERIGALWIGYMVILEHKNDVKILFFIKIKIGNLTIKIYEKFILLSNFCTQKILH